MHLNTCIRIIRIDEPAEEKREKKKKKKREKRDRREAVDTRLLRELLFYYITSSTNKFISIFSISSTPSLFNGFISISIYL